MFLNCFVVELLSMKLISEDGSCYQKFITRTLIIFRLIKTISAFLYENHFLYILKWLLGKLTSLLNRYNNSI